MFKYLAHTANYGALYTVGASEESTIYPATNLQTKRLSKVWRTITDLTNVDITIDLGTARTVDIAGLANHNFTPNVSMTVNAGTTSGVSDFTTTVNYRASAMFAILSPSQSYRYWRIRITDAANTYGFLEAGYLLLGLLETTPRGIDFQTGLNIDHISDVNSLTSETGAIFADWINDRKRITVNFGAMSSDQQATLLAFVNGLKEETNPVFMIPRHDVYDGWYTRLVTTTNQKTNQRYGSVGPLTFMEEGGGKIMAA